MPDVGSGAPVELAVDQDKPFTSPEAALSGQSAITRAVTVAEGVFAPGHLGELTRIVPFELVDAVLEECGAAQQRLRKLPARVVVYVLLAAALFEDCGYREVWRKLTGGLAGQPFSQVTATALWHARCRLGVRPMQALFEVLRGPASAIRTAGARWSGLLVVAIDGTYLDVPDVNRRDETPPSGADDCDLPRRGWGELRLRETRPRYGSAWTDTRKPHDTRGLKHRPRKAVRVVPIPPDLEALLRWHLTAYGTAPDGRLFRTTRGGLVQDTGYGEVWAEARRRALGPGQYASPLAKRPYDLRHAAVSTWLSSGVEPQLVAKRAGQSVTVLFRVYAKCLDGTADTANARIEAALKHSR